MSKKSIEPKLEDSEDEEIIDEDFDYEETIINEDEHEHHEEEILEEEEEITDTEKFVIMEEIKDENKTNKKIILIKDPENRVTSNIIQPQELTSVVSYRAVQIEKNSPIFTDVSELSDPISMAKKEIIDRKCPLSIRRHVRANEYDLWEVNEMTLLTRQLEILKF